MGVAASLVRGPVTVATTRSTKAAAHTTTTVASQPSGWTSARAAMAPINMPMYIADLITAVARPRSSVGVRCCRAIEPRMLYPVLLRELTNSRRHESGRLRTKTKIAKAAS